MGLLLGLTVLASCGGRKSVEAVFGFEHIKPPQPSKSASLDGKTCGLFEQITATAESVNLIDLSNFPSGFHVTNTVFASSRIPVHYQSWDVLTLLSPLYILYKQLKLAH